MKKIKKDSEVDRRVGEGPEVKEGFSVEMTFVV